MSGEAELNRESAGEFVYDGGGVVWKCDRQRHHRLAQTQVRFYFSHCLFYLFFYFFKKRQKDEC